MSDYVVALADVAADMPVGGKARSLAAMLAAGMPVPHGFVVLPHAFEASISPEARAMLEQTTDPAAIGALVASLRMAPDVHAAIESATGADPSTRWAVRSSAREEDSARDSFAGQLESFVDVAAREVPGFVARVWASGFSARLASYRAGRGMEARGVVPAVVVQRMIEGDASGVAFSADPVTGRRAIAVVAATRGRGAALVQGEVEGDRWRVDRSDAIVEKPARGAALSDADIVRVAALAREAQRLFGVPQDVEWTLAGGRLHALQSRPITTLAALPDPDAPRAIWDNANIIESYSGVTTPLTFSFARHCYEHVYREFCRLMGVPSAVIASRGDVFRCMLGLHRGRVYYNLASWYRLLALLPGFAANRRFMEQMMGVREALPADLVAAQEARKGLRGAFALATTIATIAWRIATLRSRMRRFYARLDAALGRTRPDLSALRPDELVDYFRRLEDTLLRRWDAPIVNDFATMVFHGLLRRLAARWIGDARGDVAAALLAGEGGFVSEEPARRVRELAALAAADPGLVRLLVEAPVAAIGRALRERPPVAAAFRAYLERFGERCVDELKLESPTLIDDPLPLYRAVGALAGRAPEGATPAARAASAEPAARVRAALAGHPLRQPLFALALRRARAHVGARENLRFERTRVFGRARQIFVELGRRFAELDLLAQPADVFYAEIDELLATVENRATTADLAALARARRKEFEAYRAAAAPAERFETCGIACRGHAFAAQRRAPAAVAATLAGTGCCPGVVRGRARLVADPRSALVQPGDILVAERTDPGWVTVFPLAAGLLVERGSLLSHSAIIARELNLPTIVALPGLTSWLRDGDLIELDGATGIVSKVAPEPEHAEVAAAS